MKLSIKDYLMIILIVALIFIWILIIENTKYNNDKSIINQKYCLEQYNNPAIYKDAILDCKYY